MPSEPTINPALHSGMYPPTMHGSSSFPPHGIVVDEVVVVDEVEVKTGRVGGISFTVVVVVVVNEVVDILGEASTAAAAVPESFPPEVITLTTTAPTITAPTTNIKAAPKKEVKKK